MAVIIVIALMSVTPAMASPSADHDVPIKGTVMGEHWIDPAAPDCGPGTSWQFYSSGTGKMSHLGKVDYFLTQCTVFNPEDLSATFSNGTITFTAANGDTLVIAQVGGSEVFVDSDGNFIGFTVDGTWHAVGGTGRFTHATGSGSFDGIADIPGDVIFNFAGDIRYDASDRSE